MTQRIEEALSRFAIHGQVRLEGDLFILTTPRGFLSIPAGAAPRHWSEWNEGERRAKAADLARAFVKRRDTELGSPPPPRKTWNLPVGGLAAALACLLLAFVAFLLFDTGHAASDLPQDGTVPVKRDRTSQAQDRSERAQRVCEATRARVARGATVNIADTDGWVVDVLVMSEAPQEPVVLERSLAPFLGQFTLGEKSRLIWPLEPELASISAEDAVIDVRPISFQGTRGPVQGATVSFHGSLIDSYFREEERGRYFHLATALANALGATHAGLAARCEHERTYHLGSWFFGKTDATAAASLLFVLGYLGDPPQIAAPFRRPPGGADDDSFVFSSIEQATRKLDRKTLSAALGSNQGMAMGRAGESVVLTFSFRDGSAAARASRHLTRLGHIGVE